MPRIDHAGQRRQARSPARPQRSSPREGAYLTDGKSLFRVERTIANGPQGGLFVELEDCSTLELIFCSARSLAELRLRTVKPCALPAG
jgi:hypothetical protein